jgi:hypothetical protein
LLGLIAEIKVIVQENRYDQRIKAKLQGCANLFQEMFEKTEKDGMGNLEPYF